MSGSTEHMIELQLSRDDLLWLLYLLQPFRRLHDQAEREISSPPPGRFDELERKIEQLIADNSPDLLPDFLR